MSEHVHVPRCPGAAFGHSDAARRVADEYNMHRIANPYGSIRKWCAFRLEDGTSDHVLYDSKSDCIRHQHNDESRMMFVCIAPATMSACDAEILLAMHRRMYENGVRLVDPDDRRGGRDVIRRAAREDMKAQLRTIRSRGAVAPTNLRN